ncbi:MAG: nickel pincer cofactor biosynthesis protein LarC [Candidatus Omnitrophica bacterium]|nr:nickel pincer cofactor biosynthesis protein LarC [Candidatus Omnitrophota bacterium]
MKIAYLDCFSGISGDMTIAAFLDAGLKLPVLSDELSKLKIKGYRLKAGKVKRGAIVGTKFDCIVTKDYSGHRSLKSIISIIDKSSLNPRIKAISKEMFKNIGKAEAKIHGSGKNETVWLHELGDIDSIIDIVGIAIAVDSLGIDEVYASRVNMGRTFVNTAHGTLPIPAPAALELLKGVPTNILDVEAELVTPTGAGLLKTLSKGFGAMPSMKISDIGYGAGTKIIKEMPNMLRLIIGTTSVPSPKEDKVLVVETNIDDMNPQYFEYIFERLFSAGALDVYSTHIQMKKTRPAYKLTVICEPKDLDKISSIIFSETTTIGIRFYETLRIKLERRTVKAKTKYGNIRVKVSARPGEILTATPEYDDCRKAARSKKVPLREVSDRAREAAYENS